MIATFCLLFEYSLPFRTESTDQQPSRHPRLATAVVQSRCHAHDAFRAHCAHVRAQVREALVRVFDSGVDKARVVPSVVHNTTPGAPAKNLPRAPGGKPWDGPHSGALHSTTRARAPLS